MRRTKRAWLAALVIGLAGASALAHDFWLAPSRYRVAPHAELSVRLLVGEMFAGEGYARNPAHVERFVLRGPDVERQIVGRRGADPAGTVRVGGAGTYVLGYRSRPSRVEMDAVAFEAYLEHEGLTHVIQARKDTGQSDAPGTEVFSRCAKSLVRVGDAGSRDFGRPLGFPLEVVPEQDPYELRAGDSLTVRVLHRGKPLGGALVTGHHTPGSEDVVQGRTDADGRVLLRFTRAGDWLLNTVHMTAAPPRADTDTDTDASASTSTSADWESLWASLTFEMPPARASSVDEASETPSAEE